MAAEARAASLELAIEFRLDRDDAALIADAAANPDHARRLAQRFAGLPITPTNPRKK